MNFMPLTLGREYLDQDPKHYVVVIGDWESEYDKRIRLQDFIQDEEAFIPVFSDVEQFRRETNGSGFEERGVLIKKDFLAKILSGDELLILNPGGSEPRRIQKEDLI